MSSLSTTGTTACLASASALYEGDPALRVWSSLPRMAKNLRRAYALHKQLGGASVVSALGIEEDGPHAPVLILAAAGTAMNQIARPPLPIGAFLEMALGFCSALAVLHQNGWVHRALTPGAFYLDDLGKIRLSHLHRVYSSPCEADFDPLLDDYIFRAPEETGRTSRRVDQRSDLYVLGMIFDSYLAVEPPFTAHSEAEWLHVHLTRLPRSLEQRRPDMPKPLADMVARLLSKEPEDRYQSIEGLIWDLQRCKQEWKKQERIESFPLCTHDKSAPQPSGRLHGRGVEISRLSSLVTSAMRRGSPHIVLVEGPAGVGKSRLTRELQRFLTERSLFISGRSDQVSESLPYAPLSQALGQVVRWMQKKNYKAPPDLGLGTELLLQLVPELLTVLPEPPASVPAGLGSVEACHLLHRATSELLIGVTRHVSELVIVLEDLHLADGDTIDLIEFLTTSLQGPILLVLSWRNLPEGPHVQLQRHLETVSTPDGSVSRITLEPLPQDAVERILSDTLRKEPAQCRELADILLARSHGNPFFISQVLSAIHREGYLQWDESKACWNCDTTRLPPILYEENVASLVSESLNSQPAAVRKTLFTAACLGNRFSVNVLYPVMGENPLPALQEAAASYYISPTAEENVWVFLHDRIHEAAYALGTEEEQQEAHYQLAQALEKTAATPFAIAQHLLLGREKIPAAQKKMAAVRFVTAGVQSVDASAFDAAVPLLESAQELLAGEEKGTRKIRLQLALSLAKCRWHRGPPQKADELFHAAMQCAETPLERAQIAAQQMRQWMVTYQLDEAIVLGCAHLKELGINIDCRPSAEAVERRKAVLDGQIAQTGWQKFSELPLAQDSITHVKAELLMALLDPALSQDENLFRLVSIEGTLLTLQSGITPAGTACCANWALVMATAYQRGTEAWNFGLILRRIADTHPGKTRGFVYNRLGNFMLSWVRPYHEFISWNETGMAASQKLGDFNETVHHQCWPPLYMLVSCERLEQVDSNLEQLINRFIDGGYEFPIVVMLMFSKFVRNLRGLPEVSYPGYSYDQAVERAPTMRLADSFRRCFSGYDALLDGDAEKAAALAVPLLDSWSCYPHVVLHDGILVAALACAECDPPRLEEGRRAAALIQSWSAQCPANFECRATLAEGALKVAEGQLMEGLKLLDKAMELARTRNRPSVEALAASRAANVHKKLGILHAASAYRAAAQDAWRRWGAESLCKQQENEDYSGVAVRTDLSGLYTAVKTLAETLDPNRLRVALLRLAVQLSSARKGWLILDEAGELRVRARIMNDGSAVEADLHPETIASLPQNLLNSARLRQNAVIANAEADGHYAAIPMRSGNSLRGVLILGDAGESNSFTPSRLWPVELLAAQAIASLDNSRLWNDLQQEVEERRRAETALRANEERLEATLLSISDGVIATDHHGRIVRLNPAASELTGWSPSDAIGRPITEIFRIVNRETRLTVKNPVEQSLHEGRPVLLANHTVLIKRDGTERAVADSAAPIRDPGGAIIGAVLVFRDVTGVERLEERLRDAQRMEAIGRLSGGIAHDFNNLLTVILNSAILVKEELNKEERHVNLLQNIVHASERASSLTRQLLAFSRRQHLIPKLLDLCELIQQLGNLLRRLIGEHIELVLDIPDKPIYVNADPGQMEQVIMNLSANARDAMPEGGILRITVSELDMDVEQAQFYEVGPGRWACLKVIDNGVGMSETTLTHIWEPFYTTKEVGQGTGLGLATVQGIIAQSGGQVSAESESGAGSTFTVLLPEVTAMAETAEAAEKPLSVGGGRRILLVEDESNVRELSAIILKRAGWEVRTATDGVDALEKLAGDSTLPHLILSDMVMPRMGGKTLSIRVKELYPTLPVFLMTGYAEAMSGLENQPLTKPFTPAALLNFVSDSLSQ